MNKLGGRPILFVCPQCGGEHFGRDTADDGLGGVKILRTVRCHTPGCGWRGEWPPRSWRIVTIRVAWGMAPAPELTSSPA
jgi:hypothetical protein